MTYRNERVIMIKLAKISKRAEKLEGNGDIIELDPTNPQHVEWFEDDGMDYALASEESLSKEWEVKTD